MHGWKRASRELCVCLSWRMCYWHPRLKRTKNFPLKVMHSVGSFSTLGSVIWALPLFLIFFRWGHVSKLQQWKYNEYWILSLFISLVVLNNFIALSGYWSLFREMTMHCFYFYKASVTPLNSYIVFLLDKLMQRISSIVFNSFHFLFWTSIGLFLLEKLTRYNYLLKNIFFMLQYMNCYLFLTLSLFKTGNWSEK